MFKLTEQLLTKRKEKKEKIYQQLLWVRLMKRPEAFSYFFSCFEVSYLPFCCFKNVSRTNTFQKNNWSHCLHKTQWQGENWSTKWFSQASLNWLICLSHFKKTLASPVKRWNCLNIDLIVFWSFITLNVYGKTIQKGWAWLFIMILADESSTWRWHQHFFPLLFLFLHL